MAKKLSRLFPELESTLIHEALERLDGFGLDHLSEEGFFYLAARLCSVYDQALKAFFGKGVGMERGTADLLADFLRAS